MKKILITLAGSCGTNSLLDTMRSREVYKFIGIAIDKFKAAKANTDKVYILSPYTTEETEYIKTLKKIIDKEKPDLLITNSEAEVLIISRHIKKIPIPVFLPSQEELKITDNKLLFHQFCDKNSINNAKTYHVKQMDDIADIFTNLQHNPDTPLWCRMREGNSSKGATKIKTLEQAQFWIDYWHTMRDTPIDQFLISEYLPGRDFAVQSLWKNGKLYLMKAAERLSYFGGNERASGVSSTPEVAVTINDKTIFAFCTHIIERISNNNANGCYNIDLKLDANNKIHVTEINAGRFYNITPLFNASGKNATFDTFIALALGEEEALSIQSPYDYEEKYICRDIDTLPEILTIEEIGQKVSQL